MVMPFSQWVELTQDYCCIKLNFKTYMQTWRSARITLSSTINSELWNTIILKFSEWKPRYIKIVWSSESFVINILISLPSDISIPQQTTAPKPFFLFVSEAHFTLYWKIQTNLLINLTSFGNLYVSLDVSHSCANLSSVYCSEFQDFAIRGNKPAKHSNTCL